jgi:hypothetical protein
MQNFAVMKVLINCRYLGSVPTFFFEESFSVLLFSFTIWELGSIGNLTAWRVRVTKIAPYLEKLGAYVGLDVAITGLRDALSAGLVYYFLSHSISLHKICMIEMTLIAISTIAFAFLIKNPRLY